VPTASWWFILAVPAVLTVVAFRDGKEAGRLVGFKPESAYRKLLEQAGVEG
jgi:thioredoxin 1